MEDIEPSVTSCERAQGGQALGLIDHIGEIGGGNDQPALSDGSLKSSPIQSGATRRDGLSELGKPQGIPELEMSQAVEVERPRVLGRPSHRLLAIGIASVE